MYQWGYDEVVDWFEMLNWYGIVATGTVIAETQNDFTDFVIRYRAQLKLCLIIDVEPRYQIFDIEGNIIFVA